MVIEKTLNTRIALKVDTLENWEKSTLGLKKGELAIATVAATAGTGLTEPVCMLKIGEDGVKTFKDLEWNVYAKASDVLAACKTEAGLKAFVNGVIADAGIATNAAMEALADKVATAEGEIDTLQADLNTEETGLKAKVAAAEKAIETIEGRFGADTVAAEIATAIANLKLADNYAAKDHKHTKVDITDFAHNHEMGEINGLATEFAKKVDKENGKSLVDDTEIARLVAMSDGANKVEASETNGKIKIDGAEIVVYTHPTEHAMTEITGLANALSGKQDVIPAETYDEFGAAADALEDAKEYTEDRLEALVGTETVAEQIATSLEGVLKVEKDGAKVEKYALATDLDAEIETARTAEKANADAIKTLNGNAETEGSVDYKIAQKFSTLMDNPDAAMNSIKELVDWTTEHAADALEMSNQVTANKNAIATLNGDASAAGSVAKQIADAIDAENLGQYATAENLGKLDERVADVEDDLNAETTGLKARMTQAEDDIDALETKVGDKTVAEQITAVTNPLDERVVALEAVDHSHANAAELDKIAEGDKAKWDAKLEDVTAAADSGLKATKTGNTVAIEIDDSVTFIFDCGGAGV